MSPYLKGEKASEGWTAHAPLPGGDLDVSAIPALAVDLKREYPFLSTSFALRLAHAYGTRIDRVLGDAKSLTDLGRDLGAGLTEREADYLIAHEWAATADDILWRRSKLGLHGGAALAANLEAWLVARRAAV